MSLQLGDMAPDFIAISTKGEIRFHEYIHHHWCILFSHPADFTPVCTTELGITAKLLPEFEARHVKVIALSVDSLEHHRQWMKDIEETQQVKVDFPIIADEDRSVANLYHMIHPNAHATLTVRSLYIIDTNKQIKLIITYPASTGRNFHEILRVVESLQLTASYQVATPGNWQHGDDVIVSNSVSMEEAEVKFPKGLKIVKPYLRYTPQPDL